MSAHDLPIFLSSLPPEPKERKFEEVVKPAQTAAVLVLVFDCFSSVQVMAGE